MSRETFNKLAPEGPVGPFRSMGWIFIVVGGLAIIWPALATIAVEQLIAWFLVLAGISGLMMWHQIRGGQFGTLAFATSALALGLGFMLAFYPLAGARTLTFALAAILFVEGIVTIPFALSLRGSNDGWMWSMLSGVASLVLAVMIVAGWPSTPAWFLGLLFGVNLLTTGMSLLAIGTMGDRR